MGASVLPPFLEAEAIYEQGEMLPPAGPGTDTVALKALVHWSGGKYQAMADAAEQARQRAAPAG